MRDLHYGNVNWLCAGSEVHTLCDTQMLLVADPKVLDVVPQGATAAYAAPEVLRSLQLQFEWAHDSETGVRINGPSADFWAVGMVLYELLTGEVPFDGKDSSVVTEAPTDVPSKSKDQWEDYESVLDLQRSWVSQQERTLLLLDIPIGFVYSKGLLHYELPCIPL